MNKSDRKRFRAANQKLDEAARRKMPPQTKALHTDKPLEVEPVNPLSPASMDENRTSGSLLHLNSDAQCITTKKRPVAD